MKYELTRYQIHIKYKFYSGLASFIQLFATRFDLILRVFFVIVFYLTVCGLSVGPTHVLV